MNESKLLNMLGMGWLDPAYIAIFFFLLFVVLLVLQIIQMSKYNKLKEAYDLFMEGNEGKSLEDQFGRLFTDIRELKSSSWKARRDIDSLLSNIESCYQKMGLVKYDAFHEMGGRLSFALCMLDKNDNGYLVNSVHSNNGCYTYTKEIVEGQCAIDLGNEEKEALSQAISLSNEKNHQNMVIREASKRVVKAGKENA